MCCCPTKKNGLISTMGHNLLGSTLVPQRFSFRKTIQLTDLKQQLPHGSAGSLILLPTLVVMIGQSNTCLGLMVDVEAEKGLLMRLLQRGAVLCVETASSVWLLRKSFVSYGRIPCVKRSHYSSACHFYTSSLRSGCSFTIMLFLFLSRQCSTAPFSADRCHPRLTDSRSGRFEILLKMLWTALIYIFLRLCQSVAVCKK